VILAAIASVSAADRVARRTISLVAIQVDLDPTSVCLVVREAVEMDRLLASTDLRDRRTIRDYIEQNNEVPTVSRSSGRRRQTRSIFEKPRNFCLPL
jgi:hypothetical protein